MTAGGAAPAAVTFDVEGGTIHALVAGAGPDLVMLHGWTLDHRLWLPQLPLADRARLVLPDRRGCGRSSAPPDLGGEWRDVAAFGGTEPVVLVGLSQGATVALDAARRQPDRIAALVLAGAPLHGVVPRAAMEADVPHEHYVDLARAGELATMKADWALHPLTRTNAAAGPLRDAMLRDYDGRDLLAPSRPVAITAADIARLPMPVVAMAGTGDTAWRRRVAAFIAATAPRGRLVEIDDAGHLCNLDNPGRFNAVLAELLATLAI